MINLERKLGGASSALGVVLGVSEGMKKGNVATIGDGGSGGKLPGIVEAILGAWVIVKLRSGS